VLWARDNPASGSFLWAATVDFGAAVGFGAGPAASAPGASASVSAATSVSRPEMRRRTLCMPADRMVVPFPVA
jgi:hypothetical protein